jgi:hypothetical protein
MAAEQLLDALMYCGTSQSVPRRPELGALISVGMAWIDLVDEIDELTRRIDALADHRRRLTAERGSLVSHQLDQIVQHAEDLQRRNLELAASIKEGIALAADASDP